MSYLKKPFQLGKLSLPNNIFYAPLAGCSDYPFRRLSAKNGPGLMYCEMVKMDALVRYDAHTFHLLDYDAEMHPIGGQICGSNPALAGQAAKIIEDLGFDVVDLNCGCPVDKVTKDGSGSGMLKTPERIGDIIANMVAAVNIPVTVKIRAGWDENSLIGPRIVSIAEQAGAQAICIHGRTREQAYKGPANWDWIRDCKQAAKKILVIGNGDIFDADAGQNIFAHTGCDAILVSRGTLGSPWIVEDIERRLEGQKPLLRSVEERRKALLEHYLSTVAYRSTRRTAIDLRRVGCWYFKKSAGTRAFREAISRVETAEEARELILHYPFEEEV